MVLMSASAVPVTQADQGTQGGDLALSDLQDVTEPQIGDLISDAELEDLQAIASQEGMSLEAAVERYAWNDNFALAVAKVRASSPEALVRRSMSWTRFSRGSPPADPVLQRPAHP